MHGKKRKKEKKKKKKKRGRVKLRLSDMACLAQTSQQAARHNRVNERVMLTRIIRYKESLYSDQQAVGVIKRKKNLRYCRHVPGIHYCFLRSSLVFSEPVDARFLAKQKKWKK
jgi:hypothetical protein